MSVAEKSGIDIARERIAEAKESGAARVDLEGLGLRAIPEELREVHDFRQLHLTQNPIVPLHFATVKGSLHELRLYCEEPGAWHPLPEGEGCYQIKESPEWLRRYGPYLHRLITVLKHVAPLVNPVLGMAVGTISS